MKAEESERLKKSKVCNRLNRHAPRVCKHTASLIFITRTSNSVIKHQILRKSKQRWYLNVLKFFKGIIQTKKNVFAAACLKLTTGLYHTFVFFRKQLSSAHNKERNPLTQGNRRKTIKEDYSNKS